MPKKKRPEREEEIPTPVRETVCHKHIIAYTTELCPLCVEEAWILAKKRGYPGIPIPQGEGYCPQHNLSYPSVHCPTCVEFGLEDPKSKYSRARGAEYRKL